MSKAPQFLTVAEIEALIERAFEEIDAMLPSEGWDTPKHATQERDRQALYALCYAVACAGMHRSAALLPALSRVNAYFAELDLGSRLYSDGPADTLLGAIELTVAKHGAREPNVRALVDDDDSSVRRTLAASLDAADPDARPLLDLLATDADAAVRRVAQAKLGDARPAWWVRKFSRDPTASLTPARATALAPTLRKLAALLDGGGVAKDGSKESVASLAARLPDALSVDLCATIVHDYDSARLHMPLIAQLLRRPSGIALVAPLVETFNGIEYASLLFSEIKKSLAGVDPATTERLADAFLAAACGYELDDSYHSAPAEAADLAMDLWPTARLVELVDRLVAAPECTETWLGRAYLARLRAAEKPPRALSDRAAALHDAGYAGLHDELAKTLDDVLLHAPKAMLRPRAEAALRSDVPRAIRWGLVAMLTRCHDDRRDGPRAELVARLCAEPRHRAQLRSLGVVAGIVLPYLREDLRAGLLDHDDARTVVMHVMSLYGDPSDALPNFGELRMGKEERVEVRLAAAAKRCAKEQQTLADVLGPKALRGPLTDAEIAAYRATILRAEPNDVHWFFVRWTVSKNGLVAEERPMLAHLLATTGEHRDAIEHALPKLVVAQPDAELIPLVRKCFDDAMGRIEQDSWWTTFERLHRLLGLERPSRPDRDDDDAGSAPGALDDDDAWLDDDG